MVWWGRLLSQINWFAVISCSKQWSCLLTYGFIFSEQSLLEQISVMLTQVVLVFRPSSYIILMQVATALMNCKLMSKVAGNREMFDENSTPGSWVSYSCIQLPPWQFFLNVLYSSQIPYKINKLQRELSLIFSISRNGITTYIARSKPKEPLLSSYLPHKSCWLDSGTPEYVPNSTT